MNNEEELRNTIFNSITLQYEDLKKKLATSTSALQYFTVTQSEEQLEVEYIDEVASVSTMIEGVKIYLYHATYDGFELLIFYTDENTNYFRPINQCDKSPLLLRILNELRDRKQQREELQSTDHD